VRRVSRGVLGRIGTRRLARGLSLDALDAVSVQLEVAGDGGWEVNPPGARVGASDRLGRRPGAVALAAVVAGCQRGHRPDCRPRAGLSALGRLVAGVGALACSGPAGFRDACERDDVRETRHSRCGRRPTGSGSTRAGNDGLDNQLGRLLRDCSQPIPSGCVVSGIGVRGSLFRRRARVGNDLSSTGAPHRAVATGRLFGFHSYVSA
jgi:hypothetical protein